MGSKSREVIWGGVVIGANMRAETAREEAQKAAREADRAKDTHGRCKWRVWWRQCLNGGYGWL